jgi:hypothetical protein
MHDKAPEGKSLSFGFPCNIQSPTWSVFSGTAAIPLFSFFALYKP